MKPFNLAEARITERHYCRLHVNKRLRVIALLIVMIVMVAVGSQAGKMVVKSRAGHVKSQLANWQKRSTERKQDMAELQARSNQRKWFRQLGTNSKIWLNVLDATVKCVPGDVWLGSVKSSSADYTVDVEGHASSFEAMSEFVSKLRRSSEFSEVRLTGSRTGDTTTMKTLDFTLKLKLKNAESLKESGVASAQPGSVPEVEGTH